MSDGSHDSSPRSPGPSVADIYAADRNGVPDILRSAPPVELGNRDLPLDVYFSREQHAAEIENVWRRTWQMACRVTAVASAGQYVVYDVAGESVVVVRDEAGTLHAYYNSCLHRGTRLCDGQGRIPGLRCRFHGMAWHLDGRLAHQPCDWDFRHASGLQRLPEAAVDTWGGFVFVNLDADARPLAEYLEGIDDHFTRWPLERRYVAAHAIRRLTCNWKVAIEGFVETYHVVAVHPETLPWFGDANSQYDVWPDKRHFSRMINPSGVPSPHLGRRSPQSVVDAAARFGLLARGTVLAPGQTPRSVIADALRERYREHFHVDLGPYADAEVMDVIQYDLFPNLVLFGGFGAPLAYRVRPDGDDPQSCLFEVYLLVPFAGEKPPPDASPIRLADDQPFASVPELSYFGPVIDQDAELMPVVQRGLRASRKGTITLGNYQECRIRHFRNTLADYVDGRMR